MNTPRWLVCSSARAVGLTAALLLSCLAAALAGVAAELPTGPVVPGMEAYDRAIPALLDKWQVPGAALAVAVDGRIVYARGFGLADRDSGRRVQPDTRFRVGSVSKILTATAILKLVEEGRLTLQDRVFPMLGYPTPNYAGASRDPRLDSITVHHLLSHTAGWLASQAEIPFSGGVRGFNPVFAQREIAEFLGIPPPPSADMLVRGMVGQPLQALPGAAYEYSNLGYLTLARLVESKAGCGYEEAVRRLLEPWHISGLCIGGSRRSELAADEAVYYDYPGAALLPSHLDAGVVEQPYRYSLPGWDGSGGWAMSAIEGVRFLLALDGLNGAPRLLQPATLALMRTPKYPGSGYGYGWATLQKPAGEAGGHAGGISGTATWLLRSANGRVHWAAFFNSRPANDGAFYDEAYQVLLSGAAERCRATHDLSANTLGWDAWRARHQLDAAAETADPDHDGLSNLVEYAAGLDPAQADAAGPAALQVSAEGTPVFTYRRLVLDHPLTWTVESSGDGRRWRRAEPTGEHTELNADGTLAVSVALPDAAHARLCVRRAADGAEQIFQPVPSPQTHRVSLGGGVTLRVAPAPSGANYRWRRNGVTLPGAMGTSVVLENIQPSDAGIYTVELDGVADSTRVAAIVGIRTGAKVSGRGEVVGTDIRHPNGNVYDQVLLTGGAATITADAGQVTRISFVDLSNDIVQVELSGAGSLTVSLPDASAPALPVHYRQPVAYVKGHATLVLTDADATTNVAVFSVGRANALNQALFREDVEYDGVADLAALAILSRDSHMGGIFLGNAHLFAAAGLTGIYADGTDVSGPVRLGNVSAFAQAVPMLVFGATTEVTVTGGDLRQDNACGLRLAGSSRVRLAPGATSSGAVLPAQPNQARIICHGTDVTAWLVQP